MAPTHLRSGSGDDDGEKASRIFLRIITNWKLVVPLVVIATVTVMAADRYGPAANSIGFVVGVVLVGWLLRR